MAHIKYDLMVALPKGRYIGLSEYILKTLQISMVSGLYHYKSPRLAAQFFLLKPKDIARLVNNGIFDVGLCSDEWIIEESLSTATANKHFRDFCEVIPYRKDQVRVSLLAPKSGLHSIRQYRHVATSYPNIASDFFSSIGLRPQVVLLNGSTEALVPSICDVAVDCVETGATATRHSLTEVVSIHEALGVSLIVSRTGTIKQSKVFDTLLLTV